MENKSKNSAFSFYLLVILGLINVALLGMWIYCLATLKEEILRSNSPMVGGAPFLIVAFIFVSSWLSYAFLGAAAALKRKSESRAPIRWGARAFWFAVIMSILSSLCYMLQSEPKPEYVGYLVELIENNPFTSYFCRAFTIRMS